MGAIKIVGQPVCEPIALSDCKQFLRVTISDDDALIGSLITAAREYCEDFCARRFINASFVQYLDTFPYYVDSNPAQIGYGPSFYTWPRYATTLWNEAQRIRLYRSDCQVVTQIRYLDAISLAFETLTPSTDVSGTGGDFVVDNVSEPPRLFPNPGQFWPAAAFTPNAVEVYFSAGYNNDTAIAAALAALSPAITPATSAANCTPQEAALRQADVPEKLKIAIMLLVADWYEHREASTDLALREAPNGIQRILWTERVLDFDTTRQ